MEFLIAAVIGLFILDAAYLLYSGSLKLFKDVKTQSDNMQTKVPSIELVARFFDRWGAGVYTTGGASCTSYPPMNAKCITKTSGSPCDEVAFWGNIYGSGFVKSISGTTANLVSCRLSTNSGQNEYYIWRDAAVTNDTAGTPAIPTTVALSSLISNNADCSSLTTDAANATASSTLSTKTVVAGDTIQRAPYKIRLYCSSNSSDSNQNWLYVGLTDTATTSAEVPEPIAPVDSFSVTLLPSGCDATTGACVAAQVSVTFRSQSKKYDRTYDTYQIQNRIFGR